MSSVKNVAGGVLESDVGDGGGVIEEAAILGMGDCGREIELSFSSVGGFDSGDKVREVAIIIGAGRRKTI